MVFLGGSDTFGRYVERPFPRILEEMTGVTTLNLGMPNGGVDGYLTAPDLLRIASRASVVVVEISGTHGVSNCYYTVHKRRNDRFLRPTVQLRALYPEVDFTEFSFIRHMMGHLRHLCPVRFQTVQAKVQAAWTQRMAELIEAIAAPVILNWVKRQDSAKEEMDETGITDEMVQALRPRAASVVISRPSPKVLAEGCDGLIFPMEEAVSAAHALPSAAHWELAQILRPVLDRTMERPDLRGVSFGEPVH